MHPAKKQKTARDSDVSAQGPDNQSPDPVFESVHPHKTNKGENAKSEGDHSQNAIKPEESKEPAPYDYICIYRPLFDVKGENWLRWSTNPSTHVSEEQVVEKLYKPIIEQGERDDIFKSLPEKHPGYKWVIMWSAWLKTDLLCRKANYCNPDNFNMYIQNDWQSYGMQEIIENMMIEFNQAYRSNGPKRIDEMWAVVAAVGMWLNMEDHINIVISNEAGEDVVMTIGLIGCALLTVLASMESAGELKTNSRFLDLPLVMGYYMELSYDLPAYGIEGDCIAWRREVVKYFKKANLDPAKGLSTTKQRMEKLEKVDDYNQEVAKATKKTSAKSSAKNPVTTTKGSGSNDVESKKGNTEKKEEDPWKWTQTFKAYKKAHHPKMGGQYFDITKMSRAERAAAAFDGKDPLANVRAKDLKENLLDFQ